MHHPANGIHQSRGSKTVHIRLLDSNDEQDRWQIFMNQKLGVMTIYVEGEERNFDGYDWDGSCELTDDENQRILDCLETEYPA
jgi:hypothetical protein